MIGRPFMILHSWRVGDCPGSGAVQLQEHHPLRSVWGRSASWVSCPPAFPIRYFPLLLFLSFRRISPFSEEQGLHGSAFYVREAQSKGLNIVNALTMDMIGYSNRSASSPSTRVSFVFFFIVNFASPWSLLPRCCLAVISE